MRVQHYVEERRDGLPEMLRMLVLTAPQGGISYVGTSIVEDLIYQAEHEESFEWVAPLILSARLTRSETFELLTGVVPRLLNLIDTGQAFRGVLSLQQIGWLLEDGSDRSTREGTAIADGDGVEILPGVSEWERLYWHGEEPS